MIKTIIFIILVVGAFTQKINQRQRLSYFGQLVLPGFTQTQIPGDLTVNLTSYLPKSISSVSITVQLREISDENNPLASTLVTSRICTIVSNVCSVVFTAPALNSTNKYTIRLDGSSGFYQVSTHTELAIRTATGVSNRGVKGEFLISPKGATNPGIRFYVETVGTWHTHFAIASSPSPTITSYDFALWSIDTNKNLNEVSTLSLGASGTLSFAISNVGYYFLTVNLQISKIDSTTRYPIVLDFEYGQSVCATGQFYNRTAKACAACSGDFNSFGSSTAGKCDCTANFEWNVLQLKCISRSANEYRSNFSAYRNKKQPKVEHFVQNSQIFNSQYQRIRQNSLNHDNQNQDYEPQNYGHQDDKQIGFNRQQSKVRTQSTQQGIGAQYISQESINGNVRNEQFGHN